MAASVVLTGYSGFGFLSLFGAASHMFDPGPYFRMALGVAASGFAVAAPALVYSLVVEVPRR